MTSDNRALEEFFAGSVGGACGVVVGHPFDTVKVRLQLADTHQTIGSVFRAIVGHQGFAGLFRGMASPLLTDALSGAVVFGSYYQAGMRLFGKSDNQLSFSEAFISGAVAGIPGGLMLCPIELVKIRLQAPGSVYQGPVHVITSILRTEGVSGLFRGLTTTMVRDIPSYAVYFSSYDYCKKRLSEARFDAATNAILSGGTAGTLCWGACYPFDVLKSRMQAQSKHAPHQQNAVYFRSLWHCYSHLVSVGGHRSLFQGVLPTLIRAFPVNAAIFGSYELTMYFLRLVE